MIKYIISDLHRYTGKNDFFSFINIYFSNIFFRYVFWYRVSKCKNKFLSCFSSIIKSSLSKKTGIQISRKVNIGYGLYIPHGYVIINSTAVLGNNITLCQFTTIGSIKQSAATLENNIYISPNVTIVENVKIGSNVVIGANSFVNKDLNCDSTYGGVPVRVIKSDTKGLVKNKFTF